MDESCGKQSMNGTMNPQKADCHKDSTLVQSEFPVFHSKHVAACPGLDSAAEKPVLRDASLRVLRASVAITLNLKGCHGTPRRHGEHGEKCLRSWTLRWICFCFGHYICITLNAYWYQICEECWGAGEKRVLSAER